MRVIFMGTPDFSVPILDAIVDQGHEVVAVYSQPPRPAGRGKKERPGPVHQRADALGLPVRHPVSLKGADEQAAFADFNADVAVVVAYGLLLPQAILDAPRLGCVNVHASDLPRWRGAAPIQRAIMAGDESTAVCLMQMEAGLDTGPVLLREEVAIAAGETAGTLHDKLSIAGAEIVRAALPKLETLQPQKQPEEGVTYAQKIDKSEAKVDWTEPAAHIDAQIRGLSPFPGAWTMVNGKRVKLLKSQVASGSGEAGIVMDGSTIGCGEGAVEITQVQPEGKGPMAAEDWLRGARIAPGDRIGE
ncbi:methionyl-tRNA formyltransferase [Gymnodinialimonas hymeniacidonis]|uniref:methionyl-tRNA formyltransferase n=1 Tax=Gymnodinialimonas hymeniacidonis TaxID=3126508 RepID=UPI0034C5EE43